VGRIEHAAEAYRRYDYWRPPGTPWPAALLGAVDRLFDRVYSSRYNPLYRTGTLAALFLTIALGTGLYLIFVYEIGRPYASVVAIQNDPWLGRWMRALHRYASDGAVVAVALHVLRLLVQGKTWGARTLAWVTGVVLTAMMLLSAVTGFVLVWDALGQKLALAGARVLRLLPLFPEPPDRAFVGEKAMPSAFFFMNLFLHVAIPLGMICLLWLHTAKLARAVWFPERNVVWATLAALIGLAVAWPAPLPPAADLLAIPGRVATDWFYAFWVPLVDRSALVGLAGATALAAALVATPWLLRPRKDRRPPPAAVDPDRCEGCRQCFMDCPYDAIEMVPGAHPDVHPLRASVLPDLCVSCGLCAGSCASLAIGPQARTAGHQLAAARELVAGAPEAARGTLLVACRNNGGVAASLRARFGRDPSTRFFEVDCAGTLHPGTVSYLAGHFERTIIVSCPPQNCAHREGAALAEARILLERRPAIPDRISRQAVRLLQASAAEWPDIVSTITAFTSPAPTSRGRVRAVVAVTFSTMLLALLALGSRWPQGGDADHALLRLGWRLTGQVKETCRDLSPEELAKQPVHMRTPRACASEVLTYDLTALVDGRVVAQKKVRSPGLRADRPLSVEEDLPVAPGDHLVKVTFTPEDAASAGTVLSLERRVRFTRARVVLVTHDGEALVLR
jgi:ferredoxin/coenzyme F420-reducing hydrogenase delta subunit